MLSIQEQIYGLSLIWSEAKYNLTFWNKNNMTDWDSAYIEILKKCYNQ